MHTNQHRGPDTRYISKWSSKRKKRWRKRRKKNEKKEAMEEEKEEYSRLAACSGRWGGRHCRKAMTGRYVASDNSGNSVLPHQGPARIEGKLKSFFHFFNGLNQTANTGMYHLIHTGPSKTSFHGLELFSD